MKVDIKRLNDAVHFEARNSNGNTVYIDGDEGVGGVGKGMRPMHLMLVSVASCSAIDVVDILRKQRQPLKDLQISVNGERPEEGYPRPFKAIDIHFTLVGDLDKSKTARAVKLAVEDYCSARATLSEEVTVTHSFKIKSDE